MPSRLGHSRLGLRLLALVVPAVLLLPAAAHAEKVVTEDATGDVVTSATGDDTAVATDSPPPDTVGELVAAPDNATADIVRTVVDHRAGLLRVTVAFRDLRDTFGETIGIRVRTPQRGHLIYAERRGKHTFTSMLGGRHTPTCAGLATTADSKADKIIVKVPTACIQDPRWVKLGLFVASMQVDHLPETGDRGVEFIDDAYRDGFGYDDGLAAGPKVRRS